MDRDTAVRCDECGAEVPRSFGEKPKAERYSSGGVRLYLECPECRYQYEFALMTPLAARASMALDELPDVSFIQRMRLRISKREAREINNQRIKLTKRLHAGYIRYADRAEQGGYTNEDWSSVRGNVSTTPNVR